MVVVVEVVVLVVVVDDVLVVVVTVVVVELVVVVVVVGVIVVVVSPGAEGASASVGWPSFKATAGSGLLGSPTAAAVTSPEQSAFDDR